MVKVYFTFIRHGESTDNLHTVWAGWRDAPLSQHGMNQAKALAKAHVDTRYIAILSSPLIRALTTAEILYEAQQDPKPSVTTSLLLREQHFGVAEGKTYRYAQEPGLSLEEHFARGLFPVLRERHMKFPGGESRYDVAERANQAIDELLMPFVRQAISTNLEESHIAIVSHGLFNREITMALMNRGVTNARRANFKGVWPLRNTGWARLEVEITSDQLMAEPWPDNVLKVRLVDYHRYEHLAGLVRQKAGIGSVAHDPKQSDIRMFFRGKAADKG
ncbi:hypothetical protein AX15_002681 [Amanita polypyramis BW_CC]|nr:hypothetical protein AX15_002681 [Amanita polypyramis BW_CC]